MALVCRLLNYYKPATAHRGDARLRCWRDRLPELPSHSVCRRRGHRAAYRLSSGGGGGVADRDGGAVLAVLPLEVVALTISTCGPLASVLVFSWPGSPLYT